MVFTPTAKAQEPEGIQVTVTETVHTVEQGQTALFWFLEDTARTYENGQLVNTEIEYLGFDVNNYEFGFTVGGEIVAQAIPAFTVVMGGVRYISVLKGGQITSATFYHQEGADWSEIGYSGTATVNLYRMSDGVLAATRNIDINKIALRYDIPRGTFDWICDIDLPEPVEDMGVFLVWQPKNPAQFRYVELNGTTYDLTTVSSIPEVKLFSFLTQAQQRTSVMWDASTLIDRGTFYGEIRDLPWGGRGLIVGSYNWSGGSNIYARDPITVTSGASLVTVTWVGRNGINLQTNTTQPDWGIYERTEFGYVDTDGDSSFADEADFIYDGSRGAISYGGGRLDGQWLAFHEGASTFKNMSLTPVYTGPYVYIEDVHIDLERGGEFFNDTERRYWFYSHDYIAGNIRVENPSGTFNPTYLLARVQKSGYTWGADQNATSFWEDTSNGVLNASSAWGYVNSTVAYTSGPVYTAASSAIILANPAANTNYYGTVFYALTNASVTNSTSNLAYIPEMLQYYASGSATTGTWNGFNWNKTMYAVAADGSSNFNVTLTPYAGISYYNPVFEVSSVTDSTGSFEINGTSVVNGTDIYADYDSVNNVMYCILNNGTINGSTFFEYSTGGAPANNAPVNNDMVITNMVDTNNLYAQHQSYYVTVNVSDADGWANITTVDAMGNQSNTNRFHFRFNATSDTFSTVAGSSEWDLVSGSCSNVSSGNMVNVTFAFMPQWDATSEANIELEAYSYDGVDSDQDVMQTNYADVVTTLVTSSIEGDDANNPDRQDISSAATVSFSVRYEDDPASGNPSGSYPPDAEFTSISVYDSANNNEGTDNTIVNGDGSVVVTLPASVGSDTYNLYVDMADADYTDGELSTTEQIITDRGMVYSEDLAEADDWVDTGTAHEYRVKIVLEYDQHAVGVGDTVTANSGAMAWDAGNAWFDGQRTENAATDYTFQVTGLSEATYGITAVTTNQSNPVAVWSNMTVSFTVNATNLQPTETAEFTLVFTQQYDASNVTAFTYNILRNNTDYNNPHTNKLFNDTQPAPAVYYYHLKNVTDDTYGITVFVAPNNITCIWSVVAAPTNVAVATENMYTIDTNGWLNVTIDQGTNDLDNTTVTITFQTSYVSYSARYVWGTNTFSETNDTYGNFDLNTVTSTRVAVDADTDQICYYFHFNRHVLDGLGDVQVDTLDNSSNLDSDTYADIVRTMITGGNATASSGAASPGFPPIYIPPRSDYFGVVAALLACLALVLTLNSTSSPFRRKTT